MFSSAEEKRKKKVINKHNKIYELWQKNKQRKHAKNLFVDYCKLNDNYDIL